MTIDIENGKSALGKIAADLTTLRVQTIIVEGAIRTADPPEPAVMLVEIRDNYDRYLKSENPDEAIVWRIKQNCELINRIYAKMDARAQAAANAGDPAIKDYVERTKKKPAENDDAEERVAQFANGPQAETTTGKESDGTSGKLPDHVLPSGWEIRPVMLGPVASADNDVAKVRHKDDRQEPVSCSSFLDLHRRATQPAAQLEDRPDAGASASGGPKGQPADEANVEESDWAGAESQAWGEPEEEPENGDVDYRRSYQDACRKLFELEPDELLQLRRIWERGVESIAMETVIELDGDVVTRMDEKRLAESAVQQIHVEMVRRAISSWQFLVDAVGRFAKSVLDALGGFFVGRG